MPGAVVLEVGAPGDGLLQVLHEVGHRPQGAAGARQALRVAEHEFAAFGLEFLDDGAPPGGRERLEPAPRHLVVGPVAVGEGVVAQHEVEVVAEYRVGVDVDGEAGRELPQAVDEPGAAVGVVAVVVVVDAAQEGAADATRHEVVVALVDGIDQQMPRGCHAPMVPQTGPWPVQPLAMVGVRNRFETLSDFCPGPCGIGVACVRNPRAARGRVGPDSRVSGILVRNPRG